MPLGECFGRMAGLVARGEARDLGAANMFMETFAGTRRSGAVRSSAG